MRDAKRKTQEPNGTYPSPSDGWVCFHCGERFRSESRARDHFGDTPKSVTECFRFVEDIRVMFNIPKTVDYWNVLRIAKLRVNASAKSKDDS